MAAQLLAQRLGLDERLQLGDQTLVPAELQLGLDAPLERAQAELGEATRSRARERFAAELGEPGPAPESERIGEELRASRRILGRPRRLSEGLEAAEVVLVALRAQQVPG